MTLKGKKQDSFYECLELSSESTGYDKASIQEALCVLGLQKGFAEHSAVRKVLLRLGWAPVEQIQETGSARVKTVNKVVASTGDLERLLEQIETTERRVEGVERSEAQLNVR